MVASVQKAMKILNAISAEENTPVPLSTISENTGINKSTCFHILATLLLEGYVKKISSSKGYVLGPSLYCLLQHGRYDKELVALCRPVLRYLREKTGYTVVLAVIESGRKYIIDNIDTEPKILSRDAKIQSDDIYRTATGRIILANMSEQEVRDVFERNGIPSRNEWEQVQSYEDLQKQLRQIPRHKILKTDPIRKRDGFVLPSYGAAIFRGSQCVGAIGIAASCSQDDYPSFILEKESLLIQALLEGQHEINRRLQFCLHH